MPCRVEAERSRTPYSRQQSVGDESRTRQFPFLVAMGVLVVLVVAPFLRSPLCAQTLTGSAGGEFELWPRSRGNYWHRAELDLTGTLAYGGWNGRAYLDLELWGAAPNRFDDSQPSPLVAEWMRVIEREQGGYIGYGGQAFRIGIQLHRRSVHHVWRHRSLEDRHDYFPIGGGWKAGRDNCENGEGDVAAWTDGHCPSLGYWQQVGLRFARRQKAVRWTVVAFIGTFKSETTLQPELWRARAEWKFTKRWRLQATTNMDSEYRLYGDVSASRRLGPIHVGIVGGRLNAPDWTTQDLWRVGLKVSR